MVSTKVYSLLSLLAYCNPSDFETTSNKRNIEDRLEEIVSYLKQTPKYKDLINEWSIVDAQEIPGTGYKAIALGRDLNSDGIYDNVVISYAGTDSLADYGEDALLALTGLNNQMGYASNFYQRITNLDNCKDANISFTGHSLGGALAMFMGSITGLPTATFCAPGIANIGNYTSNIINYVNINDPVGCYKNSRHIGQTLYYYKESKDAPDPHKYFGVDVDYSKYKACSTNFQEKWGVQHAIALATFENGKGINKGNDIYLQETVSLLNNYYYSESEKTEVREFISANNRYVIGKSSSDNLDYRSSEIKRNTLVYANGGNDTIYGNIGNDTIYGGSGNDKIYSHKGHDLLYGGSGNDSLYGDSGDDVLYGEDGDDFLSGGSGFDMLYGGKGDNTLKGGSGYDLYLALGREGRHIITDSDKYGAIIYNGLYIQEAHKTTNDNLWYDIYGNTLKYSGDDLIIGGNVTVKDFKNGDLGIYLYEEDGSLSANPDGSGGSNPGGGEGGSEGGGSEGGGSGSGSEGENPDPDEEGENPGEENSDEDQDDELTDEELENIENPGSTFHLNAEHKDEFDGADRLDALPSDPLIFDLDGDGKISLTDLDNGTNFDIDNDGFAQKISWVSGQDGILVLDRNNNGIIDNGLELFGENTVTSEGTNAHGGIDALSDLDNNNDGIIDANDSQFSNLKFLKADGTLVSLQDAGISQIILQYDKISNADEHGNVMVKSASFVKTDGSVHKYGEFMLNQNHYETIHVDKLELPESYNNLPEVQGTGLVMSLKQAMVRDTSGELLNTLESFIQEDDLAQKREIVETLIYKWAGTEDVSLEGRGLADGRKLATIEKFVGRYFLNEEGSEVDKEHVKHVLEETWSRLFDYVYAQLAVQTHGTELLAHIGIAYKNNAWVVNGGDSLSYFETIIANDTSENKMQSKYLIRDFGTILHQYNYADNFENLTEYIAEMQNLFGEEYVEMFVAGVSDEAWTNYWDITYADGVIYGGGGDDDIRAASNANNLFHGGDGNDKLQGRDGNDTIYGGTGNDTITAQGGNDVIYGGSGNDEIDGGLGNDVLDGGDGDDEVEGSLGNDTLYGSSGDDTLIGGSGDDTYIIRLHEGISGTTLIEDKGTDSNYSNSNIVKFEGITTNDIDKIWGDESYGNRIFVTFKGYENYKVQIELGTLQFSADEYKIEKFIFDDREFTCDELAEEYLRTQYITGGNRVNTTIWAESVHGDDSGNNIYGRDGGANDLIYANGGNDRVTARDGDDTVYGGDGNDVIDGGLGNDVLYGEDGDDEIDGSLGDDTIYGGDGDDEIDGGLGNDVLYNSSGNDTLTGNSGDDVYVIRLHEGISGTTLIRDESTDSDLNSNSNIVKFEGITAGDIDKIWGEESYGNKIFVTFKGYKDYKVQIELGTPQINSDEYKIEKFIFDDREFTCDELVEEYLRTQYVTGGNRANTTVWAESVHGDDSGNNIYGKDGGTGDLIYGNGGNDRITARDGDDTVYGGSGDDTIDGGLGNDVLDGGDGDDEVEGSLGNDTLYGSSGDDTLSGRDGDDVYIIKLHEGINGTTLIRDEGTDSNYSNSNIVKFEGITTGDIDKIWGEESYGNRIFVTFKGYENYKVQIELGNQYNADEYKIEKFVFDDREFAYSEFADEYLRVQYVTGGNRANTTVWAESVHGDDNGNNIYGKDGGTGDLIYGNGGNDRITARNGDDTVYGGSGNDIIDGGSGNDVLYGEDGDDEIDGGLGNDTIYGSSGNDTLSGGSGDDLYIFDMTKNPTGAIVINDSSSENSNDTIKFIGVNTTDIDKIYSDNNNGDTIRFKFKGHDNFELTVIKASEYKIENFVFDDKTLTYDEFVETYLRIQEVEGYNITHVTSWASETRGDDYDNRIKGSNDDDLIYGNGGNDVLEGSKGNDTIYGGSGNDKIDGGAGNNVLDGGDGDDEICGGINNDIIYVSSGNDTLEGNRGDDTYIVDLTKNPTGTTIIDDIDTNGANDTIKFIGVTTEDIANIWGEVGNRYSKNIIHITFKNHDGFEIKIHHADQYKIENYIFEDKTFTYDEFVEEYLRIQTTNQYNQVEMTPWASEMRGDDGYNKIKGRDVADLIYGNGGNDTIKGGNGDDTIYGGDGDDSIESELGNDLIYGGTGNDTIHPGNGDDTIVFNVGDGNDTIYDYSGNDTIKINGVSEEDISFYKDKNSLILNYSDTDSITIEHYYDSDSYKIEKIELDDGSYITSTVIDQIIQEMNAYASDNGMQISSANGITNNDELMQLVTSGWQS